MRGVAVCCRVAVSCPKFLYIPIYIYLYFFSTYKESTATTATLTTEPLKKPLFITFFGVAVSVAVTIFDGNNGNKY
jgi:hypothetical protein